MITAAVTRSLPLTIHARFDFVAAGRRKRPAPLLIVLHDYGSTREVMLAHARNFVPADFGILSLQSPHPHTRRSRRTGELSTGYGWGVLTNLDAAVDAHEQLVGAAISWAIAESHTAPGLIVLAGFSEPVTLNYIYAASHDVLVMGVIGICGLAPVIDLTSQMPPVLHLAGASDQMAPLPVIAPALEQWRSRGSKVTLKVYEAGHEITPAMKSDVRAWLSSLRAGRSSLPEAVEA
jgi:predicted esterase